LIIIVAAPMILALISEEQKWPVTYYIAQRYKDYHDLEEERKGSVVLTDKDFMEGRVKAWRSNQGFLVLQVGGKIEGTNYVDIVNTLLLAYLPIASHQEPKSFLTIGLGAGITMQAAKEYVKDVHLVEINRGVIDAIDRFGPPGLLSDVQISINDARNYLLLTDRQFDIISSEPSYPTESAVGNLFTREYYQIAASRLNSGGIYCQWLPYYLLNDSDVNMMVKTFGSTFPYVYVWAVQQSLDLLLVGSNAPFAFSADEIVARVTRMNKSGFPLMFVLSKSPGQIQQFIASSPSVPFNTDDQPLLEFHASKNLLTGIF
jgi:spermidine synthase